MSDLFPVQVGGKRFSVEDQSSENAEWAAALCAAHLQDEAFCCCNRANPVKLVVKRYGAGSSTVRFGLARWPDTGLDHDPACHFFSEESDSRSEHLSAFEDLGQGKVRAHLEETLIRTIEKGHAAEFIRSLKPSTQKKEHGDESIRRERASQRTLLFKLWRQARLNIYSGKPRSWFHAAYALIHAAKKIIINRQNETLADYLCVLSGPSDKLAKAHNEAVLARVQSHQSRMFILGRMRAYRPDKQKTLLPMIDRACMPKTLAAVAMLDTAIGHSHFVRNILYAGHGNVIGLATIEPAGAEWWKAISLATLTTGKNLLPATSTAEIEFDRYLCEASRRFIKPIHAESPASSTSSLPEVVLLDTPNRVRFQIWGSHGECLLEEKAEFQKSVDDKGRNIITWSANPREPFPILPQATGEVIQPSFKPQGSNDDRVFLSP